MFKIAHRGNISGPNAKYENNPGYIKEAIESGYDVEVDVWSYENELFLGHDIAEYKIDLDFLDNKKFWCHCKNIDALQILLYNNIRCFFHDKDDATLTSDGYIWTYPGKLLTNKSICVMPEKDNWHLPQDVAGICSDFIGRL
jgi:hypothetical protein